MQDLQRMIRGAVLKRMRTRLGFSQTDISALIGGYDQSGLSRMEGGGAVSEEVIEGVLRAMDVPQEEWEAAVARAEERLKGAVLRLYERPTGEDWRSTLLTEGDAETVRGLLTFAVSKAWS